MTTMMQEQDELQVLQTIRSLTRDELDALILEGETSGATQALRNMFGFAQKEVESVVQENPVHRNVFLVA